MLSLKVWSLAFQISLGDVKTKRRKLSLCSKQIWTVQSRRLLAFCTFYFTGLKREFGLYEVFVFCFLLLFLFLLFQMIMTEFLVSDIDIRAHNSPQCKKSIWWSANSSLERWPKTLKHQKGILRGNDTMHKDSGRLFLMYSMKIQGKH